MWEIDSAGNFSYKFFNVKQRPQYDLPVIEGGNTDDVTAQLLHNIGSVMQTFDSDKLSEAPIVRQRFLNLSHAQKSGIQWSAVQPELANMLSWSISYKEDKDSQEKTDANTVDNANNVDSEGNRISTGNLISDFDSWAKKDDNTSSVLSGIAEKKKENILTYSKDKVEEAYNKSLAQED